ncbi:MAG: response regulator [Planctomycetaceae bacterium]|nr:response regulator [Planctomycetaceae bacterium]MBT6487349.1 response regulator [Planctomycetaceae bacterium]MBT6493063.1 response regulator [Planctomycetaceae bacterium]
MPFRTILRVMLDSKFLISTAENGSVGYRRAKEFCPEIVLVDRDMPVLNGIGFLRKLRKNPELSHVPAIMLTSASSEEAVLSSVDAGANDYLLKTEMNKKILLRKIRRALKNSRVEV